MHDFEDSIGAWRERALAALDGDVDAVAELESHLRQSLDERAAMPADEAWAAAVSRLGDLEKLKREFAKARPAGTRLKKLKRGLAVAAAVCLVWAFPIRWAVAEAFYVPGKGAEPSVPQGSRILVYKLTAVFRAGDVVAFRNLEGEILLAIVKTDQGGVLTVSRHGEADREVPHARVIGRVVANTR
jgi:hypothetical protein